MAQWAEKQRQLEEQHMAVIERANQKKQDKIARSKADKGAMFAALVDDRGGLNSSI